MMFGCVWYDTLAIFFLFGIKKKKFWTLKFICYRIVYLYPSKDCFSDYFKILFMCVFGCVYFYLAIHRELILIGF